MTVRTMAALRPRAPRQPATPKRRIALGAPRAMPVSLPMKPLRERARRRTRIARHPPSRAGAGDQRDILRATLLPKPMPGSNAMRSRAMPAASAARARAFEQEARDILDHVAIGRSFIARRSHRPRRCISTTGSAALGRPAAAARDRRASADTSLTMRAPASSAGPARPRRGACRSRPARPARAQALDHRQDTAQFLLGAVGCEPGRVDSPPTSTMSAPSATKRRPSSMAARDRGVRHRRKRNRG